VTARLSHDALAKDYIDALQALVAPEGTGR
jgi:hypothetical protein